MAKLSRRGLATTRSATLGHCSSVRSARFGQPETSCCTASSVVAMILLRERISSDGMETPPSGTSSWKLVSRRRRSVSHRKMCGGVAVNEPRMESSKSAEASGWRRKGQSLRLEQSPCLSLTSNSWRPAAVAVATAWWSASCGGQRSTSRSVRMGAAEFLATMALEIWSLSGSTRSTTGTAAWMWRHRWDSAAVLAASTEPR
ncbi:Os04g0267016 [Oryza sativa Japonica Group]|uniref:Os04g0267016 protein n=1 Tax=Oryza sativa subsp. japonica TaxID=39947 RepID=A0A0P0W865_ORYSJ|nr:Os04g0267016 [Oryza sativa Japonica Group]